MRPRIFIICWFELVRASLRECSLAMDDFKELCRRFREEEKGIKRGVDGRTLEWDPRPGDELIKLAKLWVVKCYSCGLRYSFETHVIDPGVSGFNYAQDILRRLGWSRRDYRSHSKMTHFSCPECSKKVSS